MPPAAPATTIALSKIFMAPLSFCLPSIFPVLYRTAIGAGGTAIEKSGTKLANQRSSLRVGAGNRHAC
jgi:hypothetical protein